MVSHRTLNPKIPTRNRRPLFAFLAQLVEQLPCKLQVASSNLAEGYMNTNIDNTIRKQFILGYLANNLPLQALWPPGKNQQQDKMNDNYVESLIKKANYVYDKVMSS